SASTAGGPASASTAGAPASAPTAGAPASASTAGGPASASTAGGPASASTAGGPASASTAGGPAARADGALGTLLVSTAQVGEPERLEIAGTRGVLQLSRGGLRLFEADTDLRTFLAESPEPFAKPELRAHDVPLAP